MFRKWFEIIGKDSLLKVNIFIHPVSQNPIQI